MLVIFAFPSLALAFVSQFRLKVNTDRSQLGRSLQVYLPSVCSLGELLIDYMETGGDWRCGIGRRCLGQFLIRPVGSKVLDRMMYLF